MEDVQKNNIYGIKLAGRHKSVANGIKPEIYEKCGKWFETCYVTKGYKFYCIWYET